LTVVDKYKVTKDVISNKLTFYSSLKKSIKVSTKILNHFQH